MARPQPRQVLKWARVAVTVLLVAASLLLCVGTCGLWAASQTRYITLAHWVTGAKPPNVGDDHQIAAWKGELQYHLSTATNGPWPAWFGTRPVPAVRATSHWYGGSRYKLDYDTLTPGRGGFNFNFGWPRFSIPVPLTADLWRTIWIPLWLPAVLSALAPMIWLTFVLLRSYSRHRRRRQGCCMSCGYNLTANTSGVCPECGQRLSGSWEPPERDCGTA